MNRFHINKIVLHLNLGVSYHLFQVNDSHVIYTNNKKEERWLKGKDHFAKIHNEEYDDYYKTASSYNIIKDIISYINQENVNGVILNGDIIDYYCKKNYVKLENIIKKIKTNALFICGNHEESGSLFNDLSVNNDSSFQVMEYDKLIVVGLDNINRAFNRKQLELLKKELAKDKDILVFCHIPLKTKYNEKEMAKYDPYFYIDYDNCDHDTHEFISLLLTNNHIRGVFSAHLHGASQSYLKEGLPIYVTSSALIGYFSEIIID